MKRNAVETMTPTPDHEVLLFAEACDLLRVSQATLYRWIADGRVKAFKGGPALPGRGKWKFLRADLLAMVAEEAEHTNWRAPYAPRAPR